MTGLGALRGFSEPTKADWMSHEAHRCLGLRGRCPVHLVLGLRKVGLFTKMPLMTGMWQRFTNTNKNNLNSMFEKVLSAYDSHKFYSKKY